MNSGQVDKALQALSDFHVTARTPLQEMQEGTVVYIAGHRLVSAQAVAEIAYKTYPSLPTLLLLANVLQLEGRYKDVNRLLADQRKTYADSPAFLITLAEGEFDAMLYDAARADLEHAIALDNKSYQAHYLLGNVLVAQNETDRAESEYRTAIQLAPNQPRTYYQLALIFRDKQDEANEESLLKQAIAADDHYAPAYCEMGRILMGQRRLADAVTQLNLAIQYNPQIEQAYYLMARAYAGLGQKDKADATVKRYTALRAANRRTSVDTHPGQLGIDERAR
jgi:tetratricopeptide (TPR) repeat protein